MKDYTIRETLISEARDLLGPADDRDGVNPEYERALVELVTRTLGYTSDDAWLVAAAIGATDPERFS